MLAEPAFLFVTCQHGAEGAVKAELARDWPHLRFAYSRPGFLTFKLPSGHGLAPDFDLGSVFARSYGFTLGKVAAGDQNAAALAVWQLAGDMPVKRLHVWARDAAAAGQRGYEPGPAPAALVAREALLAQRPPCGAHAGGFDPDQQARPGELVLDCVVVSAREWWVGYHGARRGASCFPGGLVPIELPADAVSRAYLKMEEALRWSGLPIRPGQRVVEIGSAPGGAAQALLEHGLLVTGIDPAQMHAAVLAHPNFVHLQKRGADVRRREFRKMRWLVADMNVAPEYTLDTVEAIVAHREVDIRGLLLTLKLLDWSLAEEIPRYLDRVRGWGYNVIARQLQHNRQEVTVAAWRGPRSGRPPAPPKRGATRRPRRIG